MSGLNIVGSQRSDETEREENDYYATDPRAINDLARGADVNNFEPCILEEIIKNNIEWHKVNGWI
jgi:hypothetical protein